MRELSRRMYLNFEIFQEFEIQLQIFKKMVLCLAQVSESLYKEKFLTSRTRLKK